MSAPSEPLSLVIERRKDFYLFFKPKRLKNYTQFQTKKAKKANNSLVNEKHSSITGRPNELYVWYGFIVNN